MKKKHENIIALVGVIIIILCIVFIKKSPTKVEDGGMGNTTVNTSTPLVITKADIKEDNFTGTRSHVAGSSTLAKSAEAYIDETIATFKQSADKDVPAMRAEFGPDSPTANYEIDIEATYVVGDKTDSVVIDEYMYTGGANGSSAFKVFTTSHSSGSLLSLGDVIILAQQNAFVALVKKRLGEWRPDGSTELVIFPEDVNALTFSSFENWSFDGKGNLVLYFDKYAIGPGVLGAVAFPLPVTTLQAFLTPTYK